MREALGELGIQCLSFDEQIDQESELRAWNEGIRVKNEIFKHISQPPFQIQGYECPECLLGVNADRFGLLSMTLFLYNKLFRKGFKKIILIVGQKFLRRFPDTSTRYDVVMDGPLNEHIEASLRKRHPTLFPFLAFTSPSRFFQKCVLYGPAPGTASVKSIGGSLRVLIVVTDSEEFRSYYSRPAAILAKACAESGHQVLIATNRFCVTDRIH